MLYLFKVGFDSGKAKLFQTNPSGTFNEWIANATGRNAKTVREYLEEHVSDAAAAPLKLAVKALLQVVESGARNIEVGVVRRGEQQLTFLSDDEIGALVDEIEKEESEEKKKKKAKK